MLRAFYKTLRLDRHVIRTYTGILATTGSSIQVMRRAVGQYWMWFSRKTTGAIAPSTNKSALPLADRIISSIGESRTH
jgi:hypothetical protein